MQNYEIIFESDDVPSPKPRTHAGRPAKSGPLFEALIKLGPGKSLEINRTTQSMYAYIVRLKRMYDVTERKFIVRQTKPGWSRIWRTR